MTVELPANRTIADYAAAVASVAPTPGGGSVIGIAGALAASLASMVCRLTLKRPPTAEAERLLQDAVAHSDALRLQFLDLAAADERAYAAYREAAALPRTTDEEKTTRRAALEQALVTSGAVPLDEAAAAAGLLSLLEVIAEHGTSHAHADIATSAFLAEGTIRSALAMTSANTDLMKNRERAEAMDARARSLLDAGVVSKQVIEERLTSRP
jgi:formiminotetrahydrofolate cyclodeaminase